ncbi:hypothetical protein BGX26_002864 [Mortierella sp. AD094]|nr:hypothetical protein BGX26_002864 [Mortierella sp. AD094]
MSVAIESTESEFLYTDDTPWMTGAPPLGSTDPRFDKILDSAYKALSNNWNMNENTFQASRDLENEYLVLAAPVALTPKPPSLRSPPTFQSKFPVATYRKGKRRVIGKPIGCGGDGGNGDGDGDGAPDAKTCKKYIKDECIKYLQTQIEKFVTKEVKKRVPSSNTLTLDQLLANEKANIKSRYLKQKGLPNNTLANAHKVAVEKHNLKDFDKKDMQKVLGTSSGNVNIWKEAMTESFDKIWNKAVMDSKQPAKGKEKASAKKASTRGKAKTSTSTGGDGNGDGDGGDGGDGSDSGGDGDGDGSDDKKTNIRVCTVPLHQLLRLDLAAANYKKFIEIAERRQCELTNIMQELSFLVAKAKLKTHI